MSQNPDSPQILVVDDDPTALYAMCKELSHQGYCVTGAGTAGEALAKLGENAEVKLLIADVQLGADSGFILAQRAKQKSPRLQTMFVTGFQIPANFTKDPILLKPFNDRELVDTVKRLIA